MSLFFSLSSFWEEPWSSSLGGLSWHPSLSSSLSSWWSTSCTVTTTSRRPQHAMPMFAPRPMEEEEGEPMSLLCLHLPPQQDKVTGVKMGKELTICYSYLSSTANYLTCLTGGGGIKNSQPSSSVEGMGGASLRGTTVVDLNPTHDDDAISQ